MVKSNFPKGTPGDSWRSPISGIFLGLRLGPKSAELPRGVIHYHPDLLVSPLVLRGVLVPMNPIFNPIFDHHFQF